jgi:hypothetical protein
LREASGLPAGYVPEHLLTADRVDRHGGELSAKESTRGTQDKTQIFGRLRTFRKGIDQRDTGQDVDFRALTSIQLKTASEQVRSEAE